MNFLQEEQIRDIKDIFKNLKNPVEILFFGQKLNCDFCADTESLLRQLCSIDGRLQFHSYNFLNDVDTVKKYLITNVPAIVIKSAKKDFGIVYYGVPSGYEFSTLIETIIFVSREENDLSPETLEMLKYVKTPVIIKVFVTPTCPHCPRAAIMAYRFAMANDYIGACTYEASEYPQLVQRYNIMGVPKIVFNEEIQAEGAIPESAFLGNVLKAAEQSGSDIPEVKKICKEDAVCEVSDSNFKEEVLESDTPVIVDFFADWCNPCKLLSPTIEQLKKLYKGKVKVYKLNTDLNPETSQKYQIRSIPCVIIFDKGEVHDIMIGLRPLNDYKSTLDKLVNS